MINKLKKDYKDLTHKLCDLRLEIAQLNTFLKSQGTIYNRKESLDALSKIKEFLKTKRNEKNQMQKDLETLRRQIDALCSHSVVIKKWSDWVCPVCGKYFYVIPDCTIYGVETDDSKTFNAIMKLVEEYLNENHLIDENILEEIQYSYDVKVRRLKK